MVVGLAEGLEETTDRVSSMPMPVSLTRRARRARARIVALDPDADRDGPRLGELDGVADEVDEDLRRRMGSLAMNSGTAES